jgi:hypothetical protein
MMNNGRTVSITRRDGSRIFRGRCGSCCGQAQGCGGNSGCSLFNEIPSILFFHDFVISGLR